MSFKLTFLDVEVDELVIKAQTSHDLDPANDSTTRLAISDTAVALTALASVPRGSTDVEDSHRRQASRLCTSFRHFLEKPQTTSPYKIVSDDPFSVIPSISRSLAQLKGFQRVDQEDIDRIIQHLETRPSGWSIAAWKDNAAVNGLRDAAQEAGSGIELGNLQR